MSEDRGGPQFIPRPSQWRLGQPMGWHATHGWAGALTLDDVRRSFRDRPRGRPPARIEAEARASAVAVLLFPEDDRLHVILTRRAWHMRNHRGEVSFPGGGAEGGDVDAAATALREAHEEVGLDPHLVEVVGELDHLTTRITDRFIVPVVGVLAERPLLVASDDEVDGILYVTLEELTAPGVHRQEHWEPWIDHPMHFFELVGDTIWGATATMLNQLLSVLAGSEQYP